MRRKPNPIVSEIDGRLQLNLEERLKTVRALDLMGYNLVGLLRDIREPIAEAVSRGATVRILVVDFNSLAGELMSKHSNRKHLLPSDFAAALEHIRDIDRLKNAKLRVDGRLDVKWTSWIPSCNMVLIDAKEEKGLAKIGINPPSFRRPVTGRLGLLLSRRYHPAELDYFIEQFEVLWHDDETRKWDGTTPNTVISPDVDEK